MCYKHASVGSLTPQPISKLTSTLNAFKGQMNQKIEIFSFVALPSLKTKKNHPK